MDAQFKQTDKRFTQPKNKKLRKQFTQDKQTKKYCCGYCDVKLDGSGAMYTHIQRNHCPDFKYFTCTHCSHKCTTKHQLRCHKLKKQQLIKTMFVSVGKLLLLG